MMEPISVSLSGPAFSFLLYENTKSTFMQEGFLLGEIKHKETRTITDNDQQQINNYKTIKVKSVIPCPQSHFFYNSIGRIDQAKLKSLLGDQFGNVVAWYKYQKKASFKFTIREKVIHKQLGELFSIEPNLFSCCLLTTEASENRSTHIFQQIFMRYNNNIYDRIPMHISNLSEPNNTYKTAEASSTTFNKIIKDLKLDTKNTQGVFCIERIQGALQKHVETVVNQLTGAEQRLFELEQEIRTLSMQRFNSFESINTVSTDLDKMEEEKSNKSDKTDTVSRGSTPLSRSQSPEVGGSGRGRGKNKRKNVGKSTNSSVPDVQPVRSRKRNTS